MSSDIPSKYELQETPRAGMADQPKGGDRRIRQGVLERCEWRCPGLRTLWVWDGHWREALPPAALARLEAEVLGDYERTS